MTSNNSLMCINFMIYAKICIKHVLPTQIISQNKLKSKHNASGKAYMYLCLYECVC